MIENRIKVIQSTTEAARNIPDDGKAELLKLLSELKSEVNELAETHHDEASSITRFVDASVHEASRLQKNAQLADTALHGLRLSIQGLEESHPMIVRIVSRFATTLSNMGI
jgi:prephenate dehydratase